MYYYPSRRDFAWLLAVMSTVGWGDLSGADGVSRRLRKQFFLHHQIKTGPVSPAQVHGSGIAVVGTSHQGRVIPGVDGLVTDRPGVCLAVRSADCVPVVAVDSRRRVIGLAHAGWRGILAGIGSRLVERLVQFDSLPADISVFLGPHLRSCCCEFTSPELELFTVKYPKVPGLVTRRNGHWYLHLDTALRFDFVQAGIRPTQVRVSQVCTGCNHQYFSFRRQRRDPRFGEGITAVMIKEDEKRTFAKG